MSTEPSTQPMSPVDLIGDITDVERPKFLRNVHEQKLEEAERCFALGNQQRALALANAVFKVNQRSHRAAELIARVWFDRGRPDLALEWARALRSLAPGPRADDLVNLASGAIKEERKQLAQTHAPQSFDAAKTVELPFEAFVD